MNSISIRVLMLDADPGGGHTLQGVIEKVEGIEIVGVARNKNAAIQQADTIQTDVLLVDLMLTGYRSIEVT